MLGFSTEQLVVFSFVCLVVLGPKKTIDVAYFLGRKARGLKGYFDELKRELDMPQVSLMTKELSHEVKMHTDAMTVSLKEAKSSSEVKIDDTLKTRALNKDEGLGSDGKNLKFEQKTDSFSDNDLLQRISSLEHEIQALREQILRRKIS